MRHQEPRIGNRRWIAWKLVQLAAKIYDAEFYQRISIAEPDGKQVFEAVIIGDLYGAGVFSTFGINWGDEIPIPAGSTLIFEEDYAQDWLED